MPCAPYDRAKWRESGRSSPVDGEDREYLRWQVARLVLEPLLFG